MLPPASGSIYQGEGDDTHIPEVCHGQWLVGQRGGVCYVSLVTTTATTTVSGTFLNFLAATARIGLVPT